MQSAREQLQYELREMERAGARVEAVHVISMPHVNLQIKVREHRRCGRGLSTYCSPMRLKVSSAMRIDSVEPLTEGEPLHDAAEGISWVLRYSDEARPAGCGWCSSWTMILLAEDGEKLRHLSQIKFAAL